MFEKEIKEYESLLEIYRQINEMEKSRTTVDSFPLYKEEFAMFALVALAALLIELIVRLFGARRIV
jgi:Ca-activated chloride channel family protein